MPLPNSNIHIAGEMDRPNLGNGFYEREKFAQWRLHRSYGALPSGLKILFADNTARIRGIFQPANGKRKPIDDTINQAATMLVLTGQNDGVDALRAFWNCRFPVWEGRTREPLGMLISALTAHSGDPSKVSEAIVAFIEKVCVGFSPTSHSKRFCAEIASGCSNGTTGKPALIQELAKCIQAAPNHVGVAECLSD